MKNPFIIWLVIVIHQIAACAGLSLVLCCSHEPCNLTNPGSDQVHGHPRIHIATHVFSNQATPENNDFSGINKCSCDSPLPDTADQDACLMDSQSVCSRLTPRSQTDCSLCFADLKLHSRPQGFFVSNNVHDFNPFSMSHLSVVLVI
ncbi:MAG: hypothetical protein V1897_00830 [Pseudomonadota bacterium]